MKSILAKFTFEKLTTKVVVPEFLVNFGMKIGLPPIAMAKLGFVALLPWPLMIGFLMYWGFKKWKGNCTPKAEIETTSKL